MCKAQLAMVIAACRAVQGMGHRNSAKAVFKEGLVCRDAEVLSLFAAIITKLRELMAPEVPRVFEAIFECTLQMITKNFAVGPCLLPYITCCMLPEAVCPGFLSLAFLHVLEKCWAWQTCLGWLQLAALVVLHHVLTIAVLASGRCGSFAQVSASGLSFPSHICQLLTTSRE